MYGNGNSEKTFLFYFIFYFHNTNQYNTIQYLHYLLCETYITRIHVRYTTMQYLTLLSLPTYLLICLITITYKCIHY